MHRRRSSSGSVESVLDTVSFLVNEVERSLLYNECTSTHHVGRINAAINNIRRISAAVSNSSEIIEGLKHLKAEVLSTVQVEDQGYLPSRVYTGTCNNFNLRSTERPDAGRYTGRGGSSLVPRPYPK